MKYILLAILLSSCATTKPLSPIECENLYNQLYAKSVSCLLAKDTWEFEDCRYTASKFRGYFIESCPYYITEF